MVHVICLPNCARHQVRLVVGNLASPHIARLRKNCLETDVPPELRVRLLAIAAVESSARPGLVRGVEWTMWWVLKWTRLKRVERMTLGPFQMSRAPFRCQDAVSSAAARLRPFDERSVTELALDWNGRGADVPSLPGLVSYADLLQFAIFAEHERPERKGVACHPECRIWSQAAARSNGPKP